MGRTCIMHVGNEKYIQNNSWNLKGRDILGHIGIDGMIILK